MEKLDKIKNSIYEPISGEDTSDKPTNLPVYHPNFFDDCPPDPDSGTNSLKVARERGTRRPPQLGTFGLDPQRTHYKTKPKKEKSNYYNQEGGKENLTAPPWYLHKTWPKGKGSGPVNKYCPLSYQLTPDERNIIVEKIFKRASHCFESGECFNKVYDNPIIYKNIKIGFRYVNGKILSTNWKKGNIIPEARMIDHGWEVSGQIPGLSKNKNRKTIQDIPGLNKKRWEYCFDPRKDTKWKTLGYIGYLKDHEIRELSPKPLPRPSLPPVDEKFRSPPIFVDASWNSKLISPNEDLIIKGPDKEKPSVPKRYCHICGKRLRGKQKKYHKKCKELVPDPTQNERNEKKRRLNDSFGFIPVTGDRFLDHFMNQRVRESGTLHKRTRGKSKSWLKKNGVWSDYRNHPQNRPGYTTDFTKIMENPFSCEYCGGRLEIFNRYTESIGTPNLWNIPDPCPNGLIGHWILYCTGCGAIPSVPGFNFEEEVWNRKKEDNKEF